MDSAADRPAADNPNRPRPLPAKNSVDAPGPGPVSSAANGPGLGRMSGGANGPRLDRVSGGALRLRPDPARRQAEPPRGAGNVASRQQCPRPPRPRTTNPAATPEPRKTVRHSRPSPGTCARAPTSPPERPPNVRPKPARQEHARGQTLALRTHPAHRPMMLHIHRRTIGVSAASRSTRDTARSPWRDTAGSCPCPRRAPSRPARRCTSAAVCG